MKTTINPPEEAIRSAAELAAQMIGEKSGLTIAVTAGKDELAVLAAALGMAAESGAPLGGLRVVAACELCGLPPEDGGLRGDVAAALSGLLADGQIIAPDGDRPGDTDRMIAEAGGLDLAILGLGENSAVAFNEPATQFDTHTHVQRLTGKTRAALAERFGGEDKVPERGVTLGFRELCAARRIVVIALGERMRDAAFRMIYGRDDSIYPAAFLQIPSDVSVFLDAGSAERL